MKLLIAYLMVLVLFSCGTPNNEYETPTGVDNNGLLHFGDTNVYNGYFEKKVIYRDSVVVRYKDSTVTYYNDSTIYNIIDSTEIKDSTVFETYTNYVDSFNIIDSLQVRDSVVTKIKDSIVIIEAPKDEIHQQVMQSLKELVTLQNYYYAYNDSFYVAKKTFSSGDAATDLGFTHPGSLYPFNFEVEVFGDSINVKAVALLDASFYLKNDYISMDKDSRITEFPYRMYRYYADKILSLQAEYFETQGVYSDEMSVYNIGDVSGEIGFAHPGGLIPFTFTFAKFSTYNRVISTLKQDYGRYPEGYNFYRYLYK